MLLQPSIPAPYLSSFMPTDKHQHSPHLYLHQSQRAIEVIQLIEVPPPPPRSHPYTSTLASSSFASSSDSDSENDSEEDESVCSSYCSSEDDLAAVDKAPTYDDTYKIRLNRVLAWRAGFATPSSSRADDESPHAPPSAPPSSPVSLSPAPSLKRKADDESRWDSDDENSSQSSKRSRSLPPEPQQLPECAPAPAWQQRRWSAHSCSACDACFATLQSLRQHGTQSGLSDACREAVEYGFES